MPLRGACKLTGDYSMEHIRKGLGLREAHQEISRAQAKFTVAFLSGLSEAECPAAHPCPLLKTRSHYVALAGLELSIQTRLSWNSQSSTCLYLCLCLLSARLKVCPTTLSSGPIMWLHLCSQDSQEKQASALQPKRYQGKRESHSIL